MNIEEEIIIDTLNKKTIEINCNFKKFMMSHIDGLGSEYKDGDVVLGKSKKIEITKDRFTIKTDKNNEIIYKMLKGWMCENY